MYKHIYYIFNACDTDCACGYERTITHNYDTPNKDAEYHWNECSCGAIDSKIENTPEAPTETTEETTEEIVEESASAN